MVAKVAGGIIGLGLIGTGGVAFVKPEWLGINREVPWTPLSQDKEFKDNASPYEDTKFGGKYKNYLTGIKGKEEGSNDRWWQKSYEQWKKDNRENLGNKFKDNINGAIKPTGGTGQYLKEICDTIYKATDSNIKATPEANNTEEYKESSVWKYCSPLGQKPKTIKEAGGTNPYGDGKIGKNKESELISAKGTENDEFWKIREKEFRGKDGYKKIETTTDSFFDPEKKQAHIKELCEKAYGESKDTSASSPTIPTETKTVKYCSLEKK